MDSNFDNSGKVYPYELVESLRKRSFGKGFKKGYDKGYSKALDDVIKTSLDMKIQDTTAKTSSFSKQSQPKTASAPIITTDSSSDYHISENISE